LEQRYSISDLESLSGIKAHTLRIWESRYKLLVPNRTETNIRYYSDSDLKKVLNVAVLVNGGIRISKVAEMSDTNLAELVRERSNGGHDHQGIINALKIAMMDFDDLSFEQIINRCMLNMGAENCFNNILADFIRQLGVLWQTGAVTIAHEHFVTSIIKQKLFALIDQLSVRPNDNAKQFLLYLPSGEQHELGLLYMHFLLKKNGYKSVYLGQEVPLAALVETRDKIQTDVIMSFFTTHPKTEDIGNYLLELGGSFPNKHIEFLISGYPLRSFNSKIADKRFHLYPNLDAIRKDLFSRVLKRTDKE
jgi:MerR family transcriptional regulator, light-induced transcriptional regulator